MDPYGATPLVLIGFVVLQLTEVDNQFGLTGLILGPHVVRPGRILLYVGCNFDRLLRDVIDGRLLLQLLVRVDARDCGQADDDGDQNEKEELLLSHRSSGR